MPMKTINTIAALFSALIFTNAVVATEARAQATRTWVSGVGDDANPCSRTAPCKTFAGSISKTAAGGEISVLDPGGFGAVTITKGMTINGEGTLAAITSSGTNGIIINAGVNDTVVIRNISIGGSLGIAAPSGLYGIKVLQAKRVVIEDVKFATDHEHAIYVASNSPVDVSIRNVSVVRATSAGVFVTEVGSNRANVSIVDSILRGNGYGVIAEDGFVTISNSVIAQNAAYGVYATGAGVVSVENSSLSQNGTGVEAGTGSTIRLSNNFVYDNLRGFGCGGGLLASAGDNRKAGNTGGVGAACSPTASVTLQ